MKTIHHIMTYWSESRYYNYKFWFNFEACIYLYSILAFSLLPQSCAGSSQVEELKNLFYILTTMIGLCEEWSWWLKSILRTDQILQKFFEMTPFCTLLSDLWRYGPLPSNHFKFPALPGWHNGGRCWPHSGPPTGSLWLCLHFSSVVYDEEALLRWTR